MDYNQKIIQLTHITGYQNLDPVLNQSKCRLQILNWIYGTKTLFHFRLSESALISFICFFNLNSQVREMIYYCSCCSIECLVRNTFGKGCDFEMRHENCWEAFPEKEHLNLKRIYLLNIHFRSTHTKKHTDDPSQQTNSMINTMQRGWDNIKAIFILIWFKRLGTKEMEKST